MHRRLSDVLAIVWSCRESPLVSIPIPQNGLPVCAFFISSFTYWISSHICAYGFLSLTQRWQAGAWAKLGREDGGETLRKMIREPRFWGLRSSLPATDYGEGANVRGTRMSSFYLLHVSGPECSWWRKIGVGSAFMEFRFHSFNSWLLYLLCDLRQVMHLSGFYFLMRTLKLTIVHTLKGGCWV